jgi:ABC transporter substrate binding protein (PQQ-dependent alcohol dehydrogenase system)
VLAEHVLPEAEDAAAAVRKMIDEEGARAVILDLPLDEMLGVAKALKDAPVLLFNVRHGENTLRGAYCQANLFHSIPSDAMRMDGLSQYLRSRDWLKVLMLVGPDDADKRMGDAFEASAKKFGVMIVDRRPFVLTNDPRDRGKNNIPILTNGDYDVVFVADQSRDVGRFVPYQTLHPRPVIGTEGLIADAWHWTLERFGAPQLNQRFDRLAGRRMNAQDFASWAAVRSVVEAIVRTKAVDAAVLGKALTSDKVPFDAYKSLPSSYRPWDRQMRQTIVLHTDNAVIALAPLEGFLHQHNTLDSLGADAPETACKLQ